MKTIWIAALALLAACAPIKELPDFKPAPEGMTKAYTPYDIPIAVPTAYTPRKDQGACPQKKFRTLTPYVVGCEWGWELTGDEPGDWDLNVIMLLAIEGETPTDLTSLSDSLHNLFFGTRTKSDITKDIGDLTPHDDERYPYFSRIINVKYTDREIDRDKALYDIQYFAPVPATDTHGLVVYVLKRTVVPQGTHIVPNYGVPRDVLLSVLDEMDHIQNPELFIRTASGEDQ